MRSISACGCLKNNDPSAIPILVLKFQSPATQPNSASFFSCTSVQCPHANVPMPNENTYPCQLLFCLSFIRMLWKFATDHPTEVEPVYYMSGTLIDSRDQVMKLVKGSNYEATKKLFSNLSSVHVHSLFKKITNQSSELVRNAVVVAVVVCFVVPCCCPRKTMVLSFVEIQGCTFPWRSPCVMFFDLSSFPHTSIYSVVFQWFWTTPCLDGRRRRVGRYVPHQQW